jgi:hypothetical protein
MPNGLLCAEAVALMILKKELPNYFPRSYLISHGRMKKALENAATSANGEDVIRVKL